MLQSLTVTSDACDARLRDGRRVTNVPVTNVSVTKVVEPNQPYLESEGTLGSLVFGQLACNLAPSFKVFLPKKNSPKFANLTSPDFRQLLHVSSIYPI